MTKNTALDLTNQTHFQEWTEGSPCRHVFPSAGHREMFLEINQNFAPDRQKGVKLFTLGRITQIAFSVSRELTPPSRNLLISRIFRGFYPSKKDCPGFLCITHKNPGLFSGSFRRFRLMIFFGLPRILNPTRRTWEETSQDYPT